MPIDVAPIPGDPAATVQKMEQVRRAALAPADPAVVLSVAGSSNSFFTSAKSTLSLRFYVWGRWFAIWRDLDASQQPPLALRIRGRALPFEGRTLPPGGRALPFVGRALPSKGQALPQKGLTLPQKGRALPQKGRTLPSKGRALPPKGRKLPSKGRELPYKGQALPSRGQKLPRERESSGSLGLVTK